MPDLHEPFLKRLKEEAGGWSGLTVFFVAFTALAVLAAVPIGFASWRLAKKRRKADEFADLRDVRRKREADPLKGLW